MLLLKQLDYNLWTCHLIATEIEKNSELSLVSSYILKSFSKTIEKNENAFLPIKY